MKRVHTIGIAFTVVAAVTFGGVTWASIPDSSGVIHACIKDGKIRIIDTDAGQSCTSAEQSLEWNQQGLTGPAGPQGPTGPAGAQGSTGPAGLSGVHVVTQTSTIDIMDIMCPNNETAISVVTHDEPFDQSFSHAIDARPVFPYGSGRPGGYRIRAQPTGGAPLTPWAAELTCATTT